MPGKTDAIDIVFSGRKRDLGGFEVQRILPYAKRRLVGPFIFLDQMGPAEFPAGEAINVRPHPHIGLATVTYLFEGEILHRDSLGTEQAIRPGAVNWMTAGRGIVHSERATDEVLNSVNRMHGMQSWIALPLGSEEMDPDFVHHPADTIPRIERPGIEMWLIAGTAYGVESPVKGESPIFYLHLEMKSGAEIETPVEHAERAAFVVSGRIEVDGESFEPGTMVVLKEGVPVSVTALEPSRVMLLGGATLEGERHIWWNLVSSSKDRIEQAKADWKAGRFPKVPGDVEEFIPLPEE
ncbi:MAG: pirin family protein [Rhodospirillales bacterium]